MVTKKPAKSLGERLVNYTNNMPKKKKAVPTTKLGKQTNNRTMNGWNSVVETQMKPRSWSDWTNEQLSKNKIK